MRFLSLAGVERDSLRVRINTIGADDELLNYVPALTAHLHERRSDLSPTSQSRLDAGHVLRILDSNDEGDRAALKGAPKLLETLSSDSRERFNAVLASLGALVSI